MSLAIPFVRRTTATAGVLRRTAGESSSVMGMLAPTRWGRSTYVNTNNTTATNFWSSGVPTIQLQSSGVAAASADAVVTSPSLASPLENLGIWLSSTLKKRKTKMNKHKLQKRRKKLRLKSK